MELLRPTPAATPTVRRAFVGVVSHAHVRRGVEGGFAQLCHGKHAPLARMREGDLLFYYSPTTELGGGTPLQAFTAVGRVAGAAVYPFDMGGGFVPYRRDVAWFDAEIVALAAVRAHLAFARDPGWGMKARRGHFEIEAPDAAMLLRAMRARPLARRDTLEALDTARAESEE